MRVAQVILAFLTFGMQVNQTTATEDMDYVVIHSGSLTKASAIHIHPFTTAEADLGKPKFRDTAIAMAKSAPHLLATDIVETLRDAGFNSVTLDESKVARSPEVISVTGRFTKLDPGSQSLRVWIGFGAGESQVCISGKATDPTGDTLAEFADCRSGLGWGASGPQGEESAEILGARVARFLIKWAEEGLTQ
jgi:hypothetical protein